MQYLTRVTGEEYIIMLSLILIKSDGTDFFVFLRSIYICILVLLHNCILFSVKLKSLKILEKLTNWKIKTP